MAKRLCSVFIALLFLIPFFPYSIAASDVYVAVNNAMLPITDAMPIRSDGLWYVDYRCFTSGDLGVSASYNQEAQTLALYTWNDMLAFDLAAGTATNITTDTTYKRWTFHSNGTIYVPAKFVAKQLNMTYSFITSVNVIRIKTNSSIRDSVFAYIAKDEIPRLIDRYQSSKKQSSPQQDNPNTPVPSDPYDTKKNGTVYLTFDIGTGTDCSAILKTLQRHNIAATFFLLGSAISTQDDAVRKILVNGHAVGISASDDASAFLQSVDSMTSELSKNNDLLFQTCYTKSRLVRIPGSSSVLSDEQADALVASGYRYWDWDLDASSMTLQRFRKAIASKSDPVVIRFDASKNSARNLNSILSYLKENHYEIRPISLLTTPRNARRDKR